MKKTIEKIKLHLEKINNKKFINNLIIILLGCIIVLIVVNVLLDDKDLESSGMTSEIGSNYDNSVERDYGDYLEKKLEKILGELKGVGKVSVMVTLESSTEKITANNTTKTIESTVEEDAEGGKREINREDVTIQVVTEGNDENLLIVKEIKPDVQGVIVVAEGADDANVKESLYEAVKTVLNIKGNKVQIFSNKEE